MSQAAEEAEYQERFEGMTIESKAFQVRSGKLHTTEDLRPNSYVELTDVKGRVAEVLFKDGSRRHVIEVTTATVALDPAGGLRDLNA